MSLFNLGRGQPGPAPSHEDDDVAEDDIHAEIVEAPHAPDVAELIDTSMRQVSERMAAITTALDAFGADRKAVETKLTAMDERMRKLSTLTEMISSRYNPFVAHDVPTDKSPPPLAAEAAGPKPSHGGAKPPGGNGDSHENGGSHVLHVDVDPTAEEPPSGALPPPPWWAKDPDAKATTFEFHRHLAVLVLAEHLLGHANRTTSHDLLAYYERLGWMGPRTRRDLVAAMEGLPCRADDMPRPPEPPGAARPKRWSVEFHARSLALLARIRGLALAPEDLVVLRRELGRLSGE